MKETKSKKQKQIIDCAYKLFTSYGIKRISVEEICQTANVSKMTFYKYFKNKIELVLFILNEIFSKGEERYRNIMLLNIPYSEKAKKIIEMKLEFSEDISREMLKDIWQSSLPEVTELLKKKNKQNFRLYQDDFIAAQKKGEIRKDINPEFILYFLNLMPEMMSNEKIINMYESPKAMTAELINFFFYGILTKQKDKK